MFVQITLFFIFLLFGVSLLIVIVACRNAPIDERFDRQEDMMFTHVTGAEKQEQQSELRVHPAPPRPRFLGAFEFHFPLPPQES